MKHILRLLSVLTVSFLLTGCALATAFDRLGFMAESARFDAKFAKVDRYSYSMKTTVDVDVRYEGGTMSETVRSDIHSSVYLDDFLIRAEVGANGVATSTILVFEEDGTKRAYELIGDDVLAPQADFTEEDLAMLSGFDGESRSTVGIDDIEGVLKNEDGSYSFVADLGDEDGFGDEMATEIAAASGVDRSEFADDTIEVTVAFDHENGVMSMTASFTNFEMEVEGIDFTLDIAIEMILEIENVPDRDVPENPYYHLSTGNDETTIGIELGEPLRCYVPASYRTGWIRLELTAGNYRIDFGQEAAFSMITFRNAAGTDLQHGYIMVLTAPTDGVYYLGFHSREEAVRLTITIDPT